MRVTPETPPRDAKWGERYFHLTDPDGHAFSFARPYGAPTDDQIPRARILCYELYEQPWCQCDADELSD